MRIQILMYVILLGITNLLSQNATIKGFIKSPSGDYLPHVVIKLADTAVSTESDSSGYYQIKDLNIGLHTLSIHSESYESLNTIVEIKAPDETLGLDLQFKESIYQLEEVILGERSNKFGNKESESIARMPLNNLENPQVYNIVGKELIKEQVVLERSDLYRNVPGAVPNFSAGGSQGMSIRGFASTNGMRNGLNTSAIMPLNPAILERVEVLRGPSATLYGSSRNTSFGGVFNYVTKKPYERFGGEVSFTTGSYQFNRVTADLNSPLNKSNTALFRINIAGQSEGSFQDQGYAKNLVVAPSFSYKVNEKLSFLIDVDITRSAYTTTAFNMGDLSKVKARNFRDLPLNYKRSFINNGIDLDVGLYNVQGQMEYKINKNWKTQTNYLYSHGFYKHLLWTTLSMITDSTLIRTLRNQTPETFGNIQFQQNLMGDFKIGPFRNRMVVGIDYNQNTNALYRATLRLDTININKAVKDITVDKINELSTKQGFVATTYKGESYSAYISDVLNITPALLVMASLRLDRFATKGNYSPGTGLYRPIEKYQQVTLSPKLGVVYQPLKDRIALFANYMNGFVNLGPVTQPDNTTLNLKPQMGNQWEVGAKLDLIQKKLNATVSYYDIAVTNATRTEVINSLNFTVQDGTQRSKGYELELIATPLPGMNIIAGYAHNENTYTKASKSLEGKMVVASPKDVANIWVSYYLPKGKAQGLGCGLGANYVADSWFEASNTFVLPSYTLLNATLFYDRPKYRIALKGNNLLNQQYWNSGGMPQKLTNFLASVSWKF